jgi:hypothetical protein
VQTTAADGSYNFSLIPKGTYTVTETQPKGYIDGIDSPGTGVGKTAANDQFTFTATAGQNYVENNFAERGTSNITKGLFLASRTNP